MRIHSRFGVLLAITVLAVVALAMPAGAKGFTQLNLVSDLPNTALHTNPLVLNAWGVTFNSGGTALWVNDNGAGVATVFDRFGNLTLVVTIPPPEGEEGPATPTGITFNPTNDFVVSQDDVSGRGIFLFDTEDGTISGWNPNVDPDDAILMVDRSDEDAIYKGLALADSEEGNCLYATNFHSGFIERFDAEFNLIDEFTDEELTELGFAPFGIRNINGNLWVTFALQDEDGEDDVPGPGNGFVEIFDPEGNLLVVFAEEGRLNSPWGLLIAPDGFGKFSNAVLIGNFGDGRINAFSRETGAFIGQLDDRQGNPLVIDGLWGLEKNPAFTDSPRFIYFTAGPNDEEDGLIGTLRLAPAFGRFNRSFGGSLRPPGR